MAVRKSWKFCQIYLGCLNNKFKSFVIRVSHQSGRNGRCCENLSRKSQHWEWNPGRLEKAFFPSASLLQAEDFKYVVCHGKVHEIQDTVLTPWTFLKNGRWTRMKPLQRVSSWMSTVLFFWHRIISAWRSGNLITKTKSVALQEALPDGRICVGDRLQIDPAPGPELWFPSLGRGLLKILGDRFGVRDFGELIQLNSKNSWITCFNIIQYIFFTSSVVWLVMNVRHMLEKPMQSGHHHFTLRGLVGGARNSSGKPPSWGQIVVAELWPQDGEGCSWRHVASSSLRSWLFVNFTVPRKSLYRCSC